MFATAVRPGLTALEADCRVVVLYAPVEPYEQHSTLSSPHSQVISGSNNYNEPFRPGCGSSTGVVREFGIPGGFLNQGYEIR